MKFTPLLLLAICGEALSAPTASQLEFFENRIRPVLAQECYECHSAAGKQKGGLLLDSRPGWQAGGDSGEVIVVGKPAASLLIDSIKQTHDDLKMPKNGAKLDDSVIADFEKWIADGAPDPRDTPPNKEELAKATDWHAVLQRRKQWWCFQPVSTRYTLKEKSIDAFLDEKLDEAGLKPAPPADAATLIRRVTFVLTGLPPTPEEIESFVAAAQKDRQGALETVVDELLASPRFGEKWARHWLDWVRYAESYGSEGDPAIPYAWRYRDYVIRAFNADVPYPQMLREAIAGDLLAQPRINKDLGINESALGIAQLRMVLHGFSPTDSLDEMVTFTDNQIDTVTKAFQALTVSCARCHNHKFDAISQTDFYSLYGIFTSTHPAVIDVSAPGAGTKARAELARLKSELKRAVGEAWLHAAAKLPVTPEARPAARPPASTRWDLSKDRWMADGDGVRDGATKAGEFSIATEGKAIVARIHPAGVFTDLISTKDRGVLISPQMKCTGGTLWMRCAGGGGARARYIVQNYPRTGTIHKAKDFTSEDDANLAWRSLDLNYWKGDDIFIQCTTAADMPAETKLDQPSWFGITEAYITDSSEAPAAVAVGGDPKAAVAAWMKGTMTDGQAELLSALLRQGKLPNEVASIPAAKPALDQYRAIEGALPEPIRAPGVVESEGHDANLFVRGDHKQPAEIVERRFLDGIDPAPYHPKGSGRRELAASLTDAKNPLTSRVIVNRLWHHVFGRGIVGTPDNFGRLGEKPTHAELLDALAHDFDVHGGSMKQMIRNLVLSQAFQRSSAAPARLAEIDPDNRLLSCWTVRRLEAEAIHDTILTLSGKLDPEMYGKPVFDKDPRRSIYQEVIRNRLDPFLSAFDMPVPSSTHGRRDVTNVPAQSLALLNNPIISGWAASWARLTTKIETDDRARVERLFVAALGRKPDARETGASLAFVRESAKAVQMQSQELARLEDAESNLQKQIRQLMEPVRAKLSAERPALPHAKAPKPYAEWDFETDGRDNQEHLPLKLEGGARVEGGALVLDGETGLARSAVLPKNLGPKTLEAWVMLDTLNQRGGGVVTVQDCKGSVFDSIVFAEKDPNQWLPGSNNFKRTQSFHAPEDQDANQRPVHIAIVYDGPKVIGYRDGQLYGKGYKTEEPATFKAGESEILLGCRHAHPGGNHSLKGRILRARLYDRALTPLEIEVSRQVESAVITEADVLNALTDAQRTDVRAWKTDLQSMEAKSADLKKRIERLSPETAGWESLALSLINLKEFVYLQ